MLRLLMLVQLLAGSAAMLVSALEGTRARPVLMSEGGKSVAKTKGPIIEPESLEAVRAVLSEVEVLGDEDAAGPRFDEQRFDEQRFDEHYLTLYNPTQKVQTDSVRVQYQPTLSLFEFLLTERAAGSSNEEEKGPLDLQVEEKVAGLRLLQAELGVVVSHGLMSEQRQQWLEDKTALEEKKRECTHKWANLQESHAHAADAWQALAEQAGAEQERSGAGRKARAALVASKKLGVPQIFGRTSPKAQIALIREQVALSEEQKALDMEDEVLMTCALQLYQDEQSARERREQIIQQQQQILTELQELVEDKGAFGGHGAFIADGFVEGRAY